MSYKLHVETIGESRAQIRVIIDDLELPTPVTFTNVRKERQKELKMIEESGWIVVEDPWVSEEILMYMENTRPLARILEDAVRCTIRISGRNEECIVVDDLFDVLIGYVEEGYLKEKITFKSSKYNHRSYYIYTLITYILLANVLLE
jgi:hypothetical protein